LYNTSAAAHSGVNQAVYNQKGRTAELAALGVLDVERSQEPEIRPFVWQTDTCVGDWFYNDRARYKTPEHIIELLIDIVAKNGNLLLNIPQLPDGSIDADCMHILRQLARWMEICGPGIHGTRPYRTYGEGPSRVAVDGHREDRVRWTDRDYRFTRRGNIIYAFQMRWPETRRACITSVNENVAAVHLLGAGRLPFDQRDNQLRITLPEKSATPYANCLAIELS